MFDSIPRTMFGTRIQMEASPLLFLFQLCPWLFILVYFHFALPQAFMMACQQQWPHFGYCSLFLSIPQAVLITLETLSMHSEHAALLLSILQWFLVISSSGYILCYELWGPHRCLHGPQYRCHGWWVSDLATLHPSTSTAQK